MRVLAIDPGPTDSAWVFYDNAVVAHDKQTNAAVLDTLRHTGVVFDVLVVEKIAAMGMAVGAEVFDTAQWSGRFIEARDAMGEPWAEVKRHEVKMHLCGSMRAKDPNIRAALLDRFGPGREKAVGTKKNPGPLYGISGDCWSALAVAVTFADKHDGSALARGRGEEGK